MAGYEWTRAGFEKAAIKAGRASKKLTTIESMIAGAIAGSATVIITNPIWVINTRMTARKQESEEQVLPGSEPQKSPSTLGTFFALIRNEGAKSLFNGVVPALVLVINPILQYTIFEQLKNFVEKKRRVRAIDVFYLGAIGKLLATTITYPYITVKSRMHVAGKDDVQQNMADRLRRIIKEEGWAGLYKGMLLDFKIPQNNSNPVRRNRAQGHPKRSHGRLPVCIQGCPIRNDRQGTQARTSHFGSKIVFFQKPDKSDGNGMSHTP